MVEIMGDFFRVVIAMTAMIAASVCALVLFLLFLVMLTS